MDIKNIRLTKKDKRNKKIAETQISIITLNVYRINHQI